jgi:integrase
LLAYLDRLGATHSRSTVCGTATKLGQFGRHLATVDPGLDSLARLDRCRHIESYLAAVAKATRAVDGAPISVEERRGRVITINCFLNDIGQWGWPEAPPRRLIFPRDIPRRPKPLPRYLPVDEDRRLAEALTRSPRPLAANALLLARATGVRIGELVDLELDCVHEIEGQGAWLKVPLGKLDSERMVPLDDQAVALVDRIVAVRSPGRPLPHPRDGRPVEFLLTHHGKRLSPDAIRAELARAADAAGLGKITPHQLRHTNATGLVNAGVSLQALMAILGHTSAEMSLRYGRLFDQTVRADYERALTLAKQRLGPLPQPATHTPDGDWRELPLIKSRLAGGYCLRTAAQGVCAYTNVCEHCPNFRSEPGMLAVLSAQRAATRQLAQDAKRRSRPPPRARRAPRQADRQHRGCMTATEHPKRSSALPSGTASGNRRRQALEGLHQPTAQRHKIRPAGAATPHQRCQVIDRAAAPAPKAIPAAIGLVPHMQTRRRVIVKGTAHLARTPDPQTGQHLHIYRRRNQQQPVAHAGQAERPLTRSCSRALDTLELAG